VLLATRHSACVAKVSAINQLKALIVGAPEELRAELRGLATKRQVVRCARLRDRPARSLEHRMTVRALRSTAQRIQLLATEAAELGDELERLVAAIAPWLLELPGVGPISAAQVLVSWSYAGRLRSEAAFAALAGANPIPACSGQVTRHRLNRSGDRQLNRALHTIVVARLRDDPATRAYAARRTSEGQERPRHPSVPHWTSIPATTHVELGCDCLVSVRGRPRCFAARRPVSVLPPWTRRGLGPA
jgi:transposase